MIDQNFTQEMKTKLLAERQRFQAELEGLQPHTELGSEEEDQSNELVLDEVNQDLISRITQDLEKIEKALTKIEAGTYGTDDEGKEISMERLRAIPWADKAL